MAGIPKVWNLIEQFKWRCRSRGWWTSDYEDLVQAYGEYHSFIWVRRIHLNTFKNIVNNHCCPIREGLSYRIVNVSYIAWVFPEAPSENIILTVTGNPRLLESVAIYDLSETYKGKPICLRLNETKSIVFHEFEGFLKSEYNIDLMDRLPPPPPETVTPRPEKIGLNA